MKQRCAEPKLMNLFVGFFSFYNVAVIAKVQTIICFLSFNH